MVMSVVWAVLLGGSTANIGQMFSGLSALVFLVFSLLYTPCVAAIAAVKRELGGKWAVIVVIAQCCVAWLVSLLVYQVGALLL